MPKQRASSQKQLHFQVQPWQLKAKRDKPAADQQQDDVQFAELTRVTDKHSTAARPEVLELKPQRQLPESASPWISKAKDKALAEQEQHASSPEKSSAGDEQGTLREGRHAPRSGNDPGSASASHVADAEEDDWLGPSPSSSHAGSLDGICHIALLPSGHMSGHVIQKRTRKSFGVMARCVSRSTGRMDCIMDEDTEVLKLRILNFQTNKEAEAVVTKSGGDMARLQPAEAWQLSEHLGINTADKAAEELEVQVFFNADQLLEGQHADEYLHKYNPRLEGRNAVINSGMLQSSISDTI